MARELKDGEQVLLRGSAGALFRVTVGQPFTRELIEKRMASGEWSWPGETPAAAEQGQPEPRPNPRQETVTGPDSDDDPDRPSVSAPKSEWIVYVARTQHMSREDAASYTKADLIDMAK
jgi:hypothetical protein